MSAVVISNNQTIAQRKVFFATASLQVTSATQTLLTTGATEYIDFYKFVFSFAGGPSNNAVLEIQDLDTGEFYYNHSFGLSGPISISETQSDASFLRMRPNSRLTMRQTVVNAGFYAVNYGGLSFYTSP